jgi:hypothetical protein
MIYLVLVLTGVVGVSTNGLRLNCAPPGSPVRAFFEVRQDPDNL